jgi:hypothetical protein
MLIGKCLFCSKHLCHENPKSNGLKVVNSVNLSSIGIMQGIWISTMLVELYEQMNKYHGHKSRIEWFTPYSLLTPWSRVLLERLTSLQLVKKFPTFYGTWRFSTTFVSAIHLFLSWASSIQNDILTTIKVWSAHMYPFYIFFTLLQFPSTTLPLIPSSSLCILFCTDACGEHLCQWFALYAGWCGQKGESGKPQVPSSLTSVWTLASRSVYKIAVCLTIIHKKKIFMHCVYNATVHHFAHYEGRETGFSSMLPACLYYVALTMIVLTEWVPPHNWIIYLIVCLITCLQFCFICWEWEDLGMSFSMFMKLLYVGLP